MLCDVILWTSAPVLNNRGNGSRPGMMFTMTHTDTDTHTDTETITYKDRKIESRPRLIPPQTDITKG